MVDLEKLRKIQKEDFLGWDFSDINAKTVSKPLPWDYKKVIGQYLNREDLLLDMGTGGGEFLLSLEHPYENTYVTEAYPPNIKLCEQRLVPLGITLFKNKENQAHIPSQILFDVIINKHDEYHPEEVYKGLKEGGYFITQQVGGKNNQELSKALLGYSYKDFSKDTWDLAHARKNLENVGFDILCAEEVFSSVKYVDLETIVAYASIIEWEFPGFDVDKNARELAQIEGVLQDKGYIEGQEHRFLLICKK